MKIILDAMGGDNAPQAVVEGAIMALKQWNDIEILLAGPEETLREMIAGAADVKDRIGIIPADEVISMDEAPVLQVQPLDPAVMGVRLLADEALGLHPAEDAGDGGVAQTVGVFHVLGAGRLRGSSQEADHMALGGCNVQLQKPQVDGLFQQKMQLFEGMAQMFCRCDHSFC